MTEDDSGKPAALDSAELQAELAQHVAEKDPKRAGAALGNLGRAAHGAGNGARAALYFESALTLHLNVGDGWGAFLDLTMQGDALLSLDGHVPAALACLHRAIEIGETIETPEVEKVRMRFEVILRQIEDKWPGSKLRASLAEDAESVTQEAVQELIGDVKLGVAFFDNQLSVARVLDQGFGVFVSLGSLVQTLAEANELHGAAAALHLARDEAAKGDLPVPRPQSANMLGEWRLGLSEVARAAEVELATLQIGADADAEAILAAAVAQVVDRDSD